MSVSLRIWERRKQVAQLLGQGARLADIASTLKVAIRTVGADVRVIKAEIENSLRQATALEVARDLTLDHDVRRQAGWKIWLDARNLPQPEQGRLQLAALRELRETAADLTRSMQSLGIWFRQPTEARIDMRIQCLDELRALPQETLGRLSRARDIGEIRGLIAAHTGDDRAACILKNLFEIESPG